MKAKAWITIPHITKDDNGFACEEEILPLVLCCDCEHFDGDNCCMKNGLVIRDNGNWFCADGERRNANETN